MVIRTLTAADSESVHSAFLEAFSDYAVPLAPTREQLEEMLARRGYVPEASIGVFDEERLVAFTLNGIDGDWGYDSGTGVVPSHRRTGLARRVMLESVRLLRERGCTRYVLEVLEANHGAIALYESLGFAVARGLQCWSLDAGSGVAADAGEPESIPASERDIAPSWQNSDASVSRARDRHVTVGDRDGYAIVFPNTGDLPQLVVRREARRRSIGSRLIRKAAAVSGRPLRIMNVDERHSGISRFLESVGAIRTVRQLEMTRDL
jgi:ribosomal protein S18 acetylase RimI-like enzyme